MGEREGRPKLIFFLSAAGEVITNADEKEVEIFLKLKKLRCRSCGVRVGPGNVGYLGIYRGRAMAYCADCVEAMYLEIATTLALLMGGKHTTMIRRAAATDR